MHAVASWPIPPWDRLIQAELTAAPAWNNFSGPLQPLLREFDRIAEEIARVADDMDRGQVPDIQLNRTLDRLIADSDALGKRLEALPVANAEIRAMADRLVSAKTHQRHVLDLLKRFLGVGNPAVLAGPNGLDASFKKYEKDFEEFGAMSKAYFQTHQLTRQQP